MNRQPDLTGEDIIISVCAKEECVAGKKVDFYAKENRRYYALHYITHGNGALMAAGKEQILKAGDLFVVPPGRDVSYRTIDAWEYFWVNVEGRQILPLLRSIGFSDENLVVSYKRDMAVISAFGQLIESYYKHNDLDFRVKGYFYVIMGILRDAILSGAVSEEKRTTAFYIKEATTYLNYNYYYSGVTLESLAKNLSVNKNYLCTIFKRELGVSPMQYLIDIRLKAACKRLAETDESISRVAQVVGYKDPLYFSKEFKRRMSLTPSQYREARASGKIPG